MFDATRESSAKAFEIVSREQVKTIDGLPIISSGDHCSTMYYYAWKKGDISKEYAEKHINDLINGGYVGKVMIEFFQKEGLCVVDIRKK